MTMEIPQPFIPDPRNYGQEIADRLDGHDALLRGLTELAQEMVELLRRQQHSIDALRTELASLQPRQ